MNKDVRKLSKRMKRAGMTVSPSRGNHYNVYLEGEKIATMPTSPSDRRWEKNLISDIRRATGVDLRG
jgi:hypothetical protein